MNGGGAAFPSGTLTYKTLPYGAEVVRAGEPGMSLRDWFAGQAGEGDIEFHRGKTHCLGGGTVYTRSREEARYAFADHMIAVREATNAKA